MYKLLFTEHFCSAHLVLSYVLRRKLREMLIGDLRAKVINRIQNAFHGKVLESLHKLSKLISSDQYQASQT